MIRRVKEVRLTFDVCTLHVPSQFQEVSSHDHRHEAAARRRRSSYVVSQVETFGYKAHLSQGTERTIIGVVGDDRPLENHNFELLPGVEQIVRILQPFKLASRDFHPENTIVDVRGVPVGGDKSSSIAGPCSVESRSQLLETA